MTRASWLTSRSHGEFSGGPTSLPQGRLTTGGTGGWLRTFLIWDAPPSDLKEGYPSPMPGNYRNIQLCVPGQGVVGGDQMGSKDVTAIFIMINDG